MEDATHIVHQISALKSALRTRLLNRTATFFLRGGGSITGRVLWVDDGIEVLTERGERSISFEEIEEVRVGEM